LHEAEAFICKEAHLNFKKIRCVIQRNGTFKAEAIVNYASALITQQMEASGSPEG
jgi:hypothetical protein